MSVYGLRSMVYALIMLVLRAVCLVRVWISNKKGFVIFPGKTSANSFFPRMFVDLLGIKLKSNRAFFVRCSVLFAFFHIEYWFETKSNEKTFSSTEFGWILSMIFRAYAREEEVRTKKSPEHLLLIPRWILSHLIELEFIDWIRWIWRFNENYLYWLHRSMVRICVCDWFLLALTMIRTHSTKNQCNHCVACAI